MPGGHIGDCLGSRELEARVAAQLAELERTGRLRRFLAPQLADLIVAQGDESIILESHRREIVVVFCDLRGFTGFAERTNWANEPTTSTYRTRAVSKTTV